MENLEAGTPFAAPLVLEAVNAKATTGSL